jgi:hypothetical protein
VKNVNECRNDVVSIMAVVRVLNILGGIIGDLLVIHSHITNVTNRTKPTARSDIVAGESPKFCFLSYKILTRRMKITYKLFRFH